MGGPVTSAGRAPTAAPPARRRWAPALVGWWALLVYLVAAVGVTVAEPWAYRAPDHPAIRSDGLGYHAWTRALLDGSLSFCDYAELTPPFAVTAPKATGRCANIYPPGLALLRFPVMAPFTARNGGVLRSPAEDRVSVVSGVVAGAVAVVATVAVARRLGASPFDANLGALGATFGTGLFHFATFDGSFTHVFTAALVGVLAWMVVRVPPPGPLRRREVQLRARPRRGPGSGGVGGFRVRALVAWCAVPALLLLVRQTTLLLVGAIGLGAAAFAIRGLGVRRTVALYWPPAVAVAGGVAAVLALQVAINSATYGGLQLSSYGEHSFVFDEPHQWDVAFSWAKGAFVTYPVGLVAAAAAIAGRRWWLLLVWGVATGALITLYGFWFAWDLGGGFGHRGFVDVAPIWGVTLAAGLSASRAPGRAVLRGLTVVATVVTLGLMAAYWQGEVGFYGFTAGEWVRFGIGRDSFPVRLLGG